MGLSAEPGLTRFQAVDGKVLTEGGGIVHANLITFRQLRLAKVEYAEIALRSTFFVSRLELKYNASEKTGILRRELVHLDQIVFESVGHADSAILPNEPGHRLEPFVLWQHQAFEILPSVLGIKAVDPPRMERRRQGFARQSRLVLHCGGVCDRGDYVLKAVDTWASDFPVKRGSDPKRPRDRQTYALRAIHAGLLFGRHQPIQG